MGHSLLGSFRHTDYALGGDHLAQSPVYRTSDYCRIEVGQSWKFNQRCLSRGENIQSLALQLESKVWMDWLAFTQAVTCKQKALQSNMRRQILPMHRETGCMMSGQVSQTSTLVDCKVKLREWWMGEIQKRPFEWAF